MGYGQYTGPGRIDDDSWVDQSDPPLLATLYNYDIEGAQPKKEHLVWLDKVAIPFLKKNRDWLVSIDGLASASGPQSLNARLAENRRRGIEEYLRSHGVDYKQIAWTTDHGADEANPQCREDQSDRAVELRAWPKDDAWLPATKSFRIREVEDQLNICGEQEHIFEIHQDLRNYSRLFHFKTHGSPGFLHHHAMQNPKLFEKMDVNGPWANCQIPGQGQGNVTAFNVLDVIIDYPGGGATDVRLTVNDLPVAQGGWGMFSFPLTLKYDLGPDAVRANGTLVMLDREKHGTFDPDK